MTFAFDNLGPEVSSKDDIPGSLTPYYGPLGSSQFEVAQTADKSRLQSANAYLTQAISQLQNATDLNPRLVIAKMGLAWCLNESGDKTQALKLYREVFDASYATEVRSTLDPFQDLLTFEAGEYLVNHLDPILHAPEIEDIKSKMHEVGRKYPMAVTPLLVPLTSTTDLRALVHQSHVQCDLDGQGSRICHSWISPQAGWLVFDKDDSGLITSGKQLIGAVTFWIFWRNAYEVLSALDNDHDGKLSGAELNHLSIWNDANGDGISQPGEVLPLARWHISELSCRYYEKNRHVLCSPHGVTLEHGTHRPSYDVYIEQDPLDTLADGRAKTPGVRSITRSICNSVQR